MNHVNIAEKDISNTYQQFQDFHAKFIPFF